MEQKGLPQGIVVKAYGGFYFIHAREEEETIRAKPRGRIKQQGIRILVGDRVCYRTLNEEQAVIEKVLKRDTLLPRPPLANVDRVVVTFSFRDPDLNLGLLDRYLLLVEYAGLEAVICLNKEDLREDLELDSRLKRYGEAGYKILFCSAVTGSGMAELRRSLRHGVNVFAGPSGVGKSALLNALDPSFQLKTGTLSRKLKRGKHTTRHAMLLILDGDTYVADTPGFSSLKISGLEKRELPYYFLDFLPYQDQCRFSGCLHHHEPDCAVKEAVEAKEIMESRYRSYLTILKEIEERK